VDRHRQEEARAALPVRRHQGLQVEDRTFSCLTQNVNGFGADDAHRDEWMRTFKKDDSHGRLDVVFLQETHVDVDDVEFMARLHATAWGYRTGPGCPKLSFWSPSTGKKGGVAVLVGPYGRLKEVKPALESCWSPNFMAVSGTLDGFAMLFICIYAPHRTGPREDFYWDLHSIELPVTTGVIV
jgi:hypothetical protein